MSDQVRNQNVGFLMTRLKLIETHLVDICAVRPKLKGYLGMISEISPLTIYRSQKGHYWCIDRFQSEYKDIFL